MVPVAASCEGDHPKIGYSTIDARAETVATKPASRMAM
jgi:hypothetical protein